MKTRFLFPNNFLPVGWVALSIGFLGAVALIVLQAGDDLLSAPVFAVANDVILGKSSFFTVIRNGVADELVFSLLIIGGLLVGFSRQKNEDEYIGQIRYESLAWSVYVNFALMLFATLFVYGMFYFYFMAVNIFSLLLFFVLRFQIKLRQLQKAGNDDE